MNISVADVPAGDTVPSIVATRKVFCSPFYWMLSRRRAGLANLRRILRRAYRCYTAAVKDMVLQIPYQRCVTASALLKLQEVAVQAGNARHCSETVTVASFPRAKVESASDVSLE